MRCLLVLRALGELLRYDLSHSLFGFRATYKSMIRMRARDRSDDFDPVPAIGRSMTWACIFYWKPVQCLQRSVASARLLRQHGVDAQVVIGYRTDPFFSHAWVEVNGRVVNDSQVFQRRLQVLERI